MAHRLKGVEQPVKAAYQEYLDRLDQQLPSLMEEEMYKFVKEKMKSFRPGAQDGDEEVRPVRVHEQSPQSNAPSEDGGRTLERSA